MNLFGKTQPLKSEVLIVPVKDYNLIFSFKFNFFFFLNQLCSMLLLFKTQMGCTILDTPFIFVGLRSLRCGVSGWVSCMVLQKAPMHSHLWFLHFSFQLQSRFHREAAFAYADFYIQNFFKIMLGGVGLFWVFWVWLLSPPFMTITLKLNTMKVS